jgi:hypothetical protein
LVDQEPNDVTTAVVTGSASWPPTTAFRVGWASDHRDRVEEHEHADAEQEVQIARGDWWPASMRLLGGGDARVEADEHPAADRQRRQHPGPDRAARQRLGASVSPNSERSCRRKARSSARPMPDLVTISA